VGAAAHWRLSHGGVVLSQSNFNHTCVCESDKKERARVREKESAFERARASKCSCVGRCVCVGRRAALMQYPPPHTYAHTQPYQGRSGAGWESS
jgi:hypothetical protein